MRDGSGLDATGAPGALGVFDAEEAARAVTEALRPLGTPERATQEKRYLKSDLEFLGVTVSDMRRVVRATARGYPGLGRREAVAWARALWREPGSMSGGWRRSRCFRWPSRG